MQETQVRHVECFGSGRRLAVKRAIFDLFIQRVSPASTVSPASPDVFSITVGEVLVLRWLLVPL